MSVNRMTRVNELLRREIAEDLYRIMHERGFDLAAVTLTHVVTSPDLRHARVFVSIRGDAEQQRDMLNKLVNHRKEIQHRISRNVRLKYTPHVSFVLDESIAKGDNVLALLAELEHPDDDLEDADEDATTEDDT